MKSSTLTLAPLFCNGMVLQRDRLSIFTGRDRPGQQVEVIFRGHRGVVRAGDDGAWSVRLPSGEAGGPFDLIITGSQTICLSDVLVGEVWLASGQSNMQWRMDQCGGAKEDIVQADFPDIRFFTVGTRASSEPEPSVSGTWQRVSPDSAGMMSAVGFYFARHLWQHLHMPIGVVVSAWGGTPAETWTPREAFVRNEATRAILGRFEAIKDRLDGLQQEAARLLNDWEMANMPADPGKGKPDRGWARPDFDDRAWPSMELPGIWQSLPDMNFNGVVWFRRTVEIPADWRGLDLQLELGPIDDFDDTYVNGERVGGMGKETFQAYAQRRCYPVPARLTRMNELSIAVRVFDHFGAGGFTGSRDQMKLCRRESPESLPLDGPWKYAVEERLPPPRPDLFSTYPAMPVGLLPEHRPGHVFNGMIAPLRHVNFAGVLWYQGESNGGRSSEYADLFKALIEGWRTFFQRADLPFLFVQLPNFSAGGDWPLLREAQARALQLPRTAMVITLDVGDNADIHPQRKEPVGRRLALAALADVYGVQIPAHSPVVQHLEWCPPSVRVEFANTYGELNTTDGHSPLTFEVAGPDGNYRPATTRVDGSSVWVASEEVQEPIGVRYAFHASPPVNLVNGAGLPAAPFRCDAAAR